MRPVVAVSMDQRSLGPKPSGTQGRVRPALPEVMLKTAIIDALRHAGVEPLLIPPHEGDPKPIVEWLQTHCDGFVVTGGAFDIHPSQYGATVEARLDRVDTARTGLELEMCRAAMNHQTPILGLCGGLQALAVACGGTLIQDILTRDPDALQHEQLTDPRQASHDVELSQSMLERWTHSHRLKVNSTHHQAILSPGRLRITGRAPDGTVEVAEAPEHPFALGVQWHQELLTEHDAGRAVFSAFAHATKQRH